MFRWPVRDSLNQSMIAGLHDRPHDPVEGRVHAAPTRAPEETRQRVRSISLLRHQVLLPGQAGLLRAGGTLRGVEWQRTVNGALAGAVAAAVWAAQQPLDKRVFRSGYDDLEILGKLVARDSSWPLAGLAIHVQYGAFFGATYSQLRPFIPGPPVARAVAAATAEHLALWPLGRLVDRYHPARGELTQIGGNRRAFAQATWRHLLFGALLGELERRLNPADAYEPLEVPVSSNGHGDIEQAAVGAT